MKVPALAPRFRDYLRLLARRWIVILSATVLSGAGGWIAWETGQHTWVSASKVLITTPAGAMPPDAFYGNFTAKATVTNFVALAKSRQVTVRSINQVGLNLTPEEFADDITVGFSDSAVLTIAVTGEDPYQTAEAANAVTANMIQLSREAAKVSKGATELTLVDPASPPVPTGTFKTYLIWSLSLGLALSSILVLAIELPRRRVMARDQIAHVAAAKIREME